MGGCRVVSDEHHDHPPIYSSDRKEFVVRVLITVGTTVTVLSLLALLCYAVDMLLLVFAGILVAVLLRAPATWLAAHTPLKPAWAVGVVILAFALLLWGGGRFITVPVMDQLQTLSATLPQTVENVTQRLMSNRWGQELVRQTESINWSSRRMNVLGRMTGAISTAFGFITDVFIILFLGIYFSMQPRPYISGLLRLVPKGGRPRATEVLQDIGKNLRLWLVAKLCSMAIVGVLTWGGLWLLGMPFALALALLAGIFSFVPYIGPFVSAVPAVLLAFTLGGTGSCHGGTVAVEH